MKIVLTASYLLLTSAIFAQTREEFFDFGFHPTKTSPYYYVTTEKNDSVWDQKAYYISTLKMASECFYRDENCSKAHGNCKSYDIDGFLKETGNYLNGLKEGTWLRYNNKGMITDSATYVSGHPKGVEMRWYDNGMPSDSLNFDGAGNGVQVTWYNDGTLSSAGYWTQDTLKKGRWKYFFNDGSIRATEDYTNGKVTVCNCYTEKGEPIDTALCREKEAKPANGADGWRRFLQKGLQRIVENLVSKGAKPGRYTIMIRFLVLEDGTVTDLSPMTRFGHGVEEEVIEAMKSAPKWEPGILFGKPVKSYHSQPITFVIQE